MRSPQDMINATFALDKKRYEMRLRHVRIAFWIAILFLIGGLAAICIGIYSFKGSPFSGGLTTVVGVISSFISTVIFKFYNNENKRLDETRHDLNATAIFIEGLPERERIIDKIPDPVERTKELKALAKMITDGPSLANRSVTTISTGQNNLGFWKRTVKAMFKL